LNEDLLKVKIAKYHYHLGMSKVEIGEKLRISRFKVAEYLEKARHEGIVKIIIEDNFNDYTDLENEIEKKFNLYKAIIVDSYPDYEQTRNNIGKAAADFLVDFINNEDVIGIAWGTTIFNMVKNLPEEISRKNISVVQITGGLNQVQIEYNAMELAYRIAKILKAKIYPLYAPSIVDNKETKEALLCDSNIKKTIDMFLEINMAIVGIGSVVPKPSTLLYRNGFIKKDDAIDIHKTNAVGDINSFFL
jgi:DNA-binding transcriptional regulator LsrR (DeoR family)